MLHDVICASLALPLAFLVRTGELPPLSEPFLVMQATLVVSATLASHWFSLNKGSWRYASIDDLLGIIQVSAVAILAATVVTFTAFRLEQIPRVVVPLGFLFLVVLMSALRLIYRVMKDRHIQRYFRSKAQGEPVLLVGYSDEANAFLGQLARQREPDYEVVGIVDHNARHEGRVLHGAEVIGQLGELEAIIEHTKATKGRLRKILISPSKIDKAATRFIVDLAASYAIPVYSLPGSSGLTETTHERLMRPVPIRIDDLLGRPNAMIDIDAIAGLLRGKRILVTGGGGSIGGELVDQILTYEPAQLIVVESNEHNLYVIERDMRERRPRSHFHGVLADIRDRGRLRDIFREFAPDIVFHAAH